MEKTLKFSTGSITYRLPNVPQTLRLIAKLGLTETGLPAGKSMYEFTADFIELVEPYIVSVEIKKGKDVIKTWEEALNCTEIMEPCSQIMTEFLTALQGAPENEKKS